VSIDAKSNRDARKYTATEQLLRVLWSLDQLAMHLSPRLFFAWRRLVLRAFGANVGRHVHVYPSTRVYMPWNLVAGDWATIGEDALIYNLGSVSIGCRATVSYRAHICAGTHDFSDPALPLLKPQVVICDDAWIGTDAFVGPGVTVGRGAVVGGRAVVVDDVPELQIVAGNPARRIGTRAFVSNEN
jgi:putative colanic acid biosynthesis acetyltransferase WcaF